MRLLALEVDRDRQAHERKLQVFNDLQRVVSSLTTELGNKAEAWPELSASINSSRDHFEQWMKDNEATYTAEDLDE